MRPANCLRMEQQSDGRRSSGNEKAAARGTGDGLSESLTAGACRRAEGYRRSTGHI